MKFLANVITSNVIGDYNFDILGQSNELGGPHNQSQTNSARVFEFSSKNFIMVSVGTYEGGVHSIFPRFASSTYPV